MSPPLYSRISFWRPKVEIAFAATTASPFDEGERGRALEHRVELGGAGPLHRPLGEPVLDDPEGGIGLRELRAQLGGLGNADAPVVDSEDRARVAEAVGDLVDQC